MSELLMLCWEFFRTGLLAVGGGLATLPFLTEMSLNHPTWFNMDMLSNMVAVSESTPGPMGVNMATYVGFSVAGVPGAILATLSLVLPSIGIIILITRILKRFKESALVASVFSGLRPAVTGLIAAAAYNVMQMALFHNYTTSSVGAFLGSVSWFNVAVFALMFFFLHWKRTAKLHPIVFIGTCAVIGVAFGL